MKNLKNTIQKEIDLISGRLIEVSDELFNNPELGGEEFKAVKLLTEELKKNGFNVETGISGLKTSFYAEFNFKNIGPSLALLFEYDALKGLGHACGHNISAAASLGAAISLSKLNNELCGKIVCIGTPGEENFSGKIIMGKNGVFKNIDVAMMVHAGDENNTNLIFLAADEIELNFYGKPSHAAAAPYDGINALDASILFFNAVNALRQQLREDIRIHGNIIKGGTAVNIIPDHSVIRLNVRSKSRNYLNIVSEKVKDCARGAAMQTGTRLEISNFADPCDDLLENDILNKEYEENIKMLGEILSQEKKVLGSSDIGNTSYLVPTMHPMVKTTASGVALHTEQLAKDAVSELGHRGLIIGAKALAMTAAKVLSDNVFVDLLKREFYEKKSSKK